MEHSDADDPIAPPPPKPTETVKHLLRETDTTLAEIEAELSDFPEDETGRPRIDLAKPLHRIVDRCVRLLAKRDDVFQKHGELVQVVQEQAGVRLRPLRSPLVRTVLSRGADWLQEGKPTHPPAHVAKCIIERTSWERIRVLRAVTPFPAMSSNGSMRTDAGYDVTTQTFFAGGCVVSVPEHPTQDDARRAVAVIFDIVQDFPFASDEHRASWLAGLLTPLARYAHDGNAPITIVQANQQRAGKTTLAQLIGEIVNGGACPVITFTKNEDESRKRVLSFLRTARAMVLVDNVVGCFGGANVNALTTSRTFEDRVLGRSVIMEVVNDTSWYVTGNNIQLAADTAERCLNVRLHCEESHAHLRTGFRYPFLFETVRERRGELLSAALTIIKAYIVSGRPDQKLPAWGGFEPWSRLVRGAIVFAGQPDPAATRVELEEQADVETDAKAALVIAMHEWQLHEAVHEPIRAAEILMHLRDRPTSAPRLRQALEDLAGMTGKLPTPAVFARTLREAQGRNFGGFRLTKRSDLKNGHRWRVEQIGAVAIREGAQLADAAE